MPGASATTRAAMPGRRVARPDVQEHVVPDDDEEPRGGNARRVAACEPGKPACAPEDVGEAGRRDRVAQDRDVARRHPVVEERLDDGERARPHDDDREQRDVRSCVHRSGQRARTPHREVVNEPPGRDTSSRVRDPGRLRRGVGRRHLHARPGHGADHSQHALRGRRGGIATATGIIGGIAVWTLAASAGVAALLSASEPVFRALQIAGAAYLVYLGAAVHPLGVSRRPDRCSVERRADAHTETRVPPGLAEQPRQPDRVRTQR